jgi:hypothetical protein
MHESWAVSPTRNEMVISRSADVSCVRIAFERDEADNQL